MDTRKKLNTDILLNILSQQAVSNLALTTLVESKLSRADRDELRKVNMELIDKNDKLVQRSEILDAQK